MNEIIYTDGDGWQVEFHRDDETQCCVLSIARPDGAVMRLGDLELGDWADDVPGNLAEDWLRAWRNTTWGKFAELGYAVGELGRTVAAQPLWWKLGILFWMAVGWGLWALL